MKKLKWVVLAVAIAILLTAGLATASPTFQRDMFGWIVATRLTVRNMTQFQGAVDVDSTLNVDGAATFASTTAHTGAATFAASITQSNGNVAIADFASIAEQTFITVTQSGYITPTGTHQPIRAAASIGTRLIATRTMSAGDLLILRNESNTTITLTDTAPLALSGNAALAQNDVVVLMFDGTSWVQIAPEGDN